MNSLILLLEHINTVGPIASIVPTINIISKLRNSPKNPYIIVDKACPPEDVAYTNPKITPRCSSGKANIKDASKIEFPIAFPYVAIKFNKTRIINEFDKNDGMANTPYNENPITNK